MNSIKKIAAVFLALLMLMSFCSCSFTEERIDGEPENDIVSRPDNNKDKEEDKKQEHAAQEESDTLSKKEVDALASAALQKLSAIPEYPAGYPTRDDVVAQYKRACEAIGWIVGTELVATDGDYAHSSHGMNYYKVLPDCYLGAKNAGKNPDADMLIYNKETFEAYLATLIAKDEAHEYIVDITESFDVPRFVESKNGELYALPYAFPPAGYGEEDTFELKANGDGSYTLSVHYTTLDDNDEVDGEHTYDVKYIKKDGRWVFENFLLVKQH